MLTDARCRTAKPTDKPYKLSDGKGLCLEHVPGAIALSSGPKAKSRRGCSRSATMSPPPTAESPEDAKSRRAGRNFTLAEAREERAKARALVKQGINPVHHRQVNSIKQGTGLLTNSSLQG